MTSLKEGLRFSLSLLFVWLSLAHAQVESPIKPGEILTDTPPRDSPAPAAMIRAIEQRKSELDKRSQELDLREERLRLMEQEVSQMLKKYSEIREALEEKEKKWKETEEKQVGRLAKMYEAMPAEEAAARIEKMDESLALTLLGKIKEKSAAQILTGLSPLKAAKLTEKLAKPPR
jgi:flagellar motility protein MotE (MotC chaperone)